MAQINFEENFKNKLEKRTIEPTDNAWDKLSNKLDNLNNKSNAKKNWWLGIAASLVGVLLISTLFLISDEKTATSPILVATPVIETEKAKEESLERNDVVQNEEPIEEVNTTQTKSNTSKTKQKGDNKTIINIRKERNSNKEAIVSNTIEKDENLININIKKEDVHEIVTQNSELKINTESTIDSEINLLLDNAQKDIALNRNIKDMAMVVNANSLLEEVEIDLEQTFRDKVFNSLKSSFNKVKTAVAERNQ